MKNAGNDKISITAEFVSIMRSGDDIKNLYFVSPKGFRLYDATKMFIPEKKLREIFNWRLRLSAVIDEKISTAKPEQIIDFGSGYSLRGFNLCTDDNSLNYVDADLSSVTSRKKKILEKMCLEKNFAFPKNYHIVSLNVLGDNLFEEIGGVIDANKNTLIIAEGLTSYFSKDEFASFINNTRSLLKNFRHAEFYSHENISQPKGILYKILRYVFVSILTRSRGRRGFDNIEEFKKYLGGLGAKFALDTSKDGFLFYSLFKD